MAKSLKDILQGVKSSKKVTNDLGGYKPKAGDEEDFAKEHEIEKYADRVGNGDDVYAATNVEPALKKEKRHGYKNLKDAEKVYEEKKTCNMTEEGTMCEVHGMSDCSKGGKKVLKEKEPVTEAWYSEKGGERTYHKGQRDAMRHAREIGGKYGATHGAQGMKASKALGWDAKEKEGLGIGLTSKADKVKAAQKQKAAKKAGPWGLKEASVPATIIKNLPAVKNKLPAIAGAAKDAWGSAATMAAGAGAAIGNYLKGDDKPKDTAPKGRDSNIKTTDGYTGGNAVGGYKKPDPFDWDDGKRDSSIRTTDGVTGGNAEVEPKTKIDASPKPGPSVADFMDAAKKTIAAKSKAAAPKADDDDDDYDYSTRVIDGVTVRPLFKNKAEKAEHDRATKASMDPEGPTQKFLKGLRDKQSAGEEPSRPSETPPSAERKPKPQNDGPYYHDDKPKNYGPYYRDDNKTKLPNDGILLLRKQAVNEVLSKKADAGEWISDFVHSDNPKFKGKSKEKRKQMALAAYYAKQRNEEVEIEEEKEEKQHIEVTNRHTGAKKYIDVHPSKAYAALNHYKKSGDKARIVTGRKSKEDLEEAVKTGNEGHGYHGEAYGAATSDDKMAEAGKAYAKAHALVKQHAAEHLRDVKNPNKMVKHYLDSQYGRHLHGNEHDAGYVKRDFAHFKKKYKPEMHEQAEIEEALKGKQHKIDKNKNGKIDAEDFRLLRKEDLAVPLLGSMSGEKIGKTNLKKKVKKEQTGPDTPLTLPNMSVDVNTGRNV